MELTILATFTLIIIGIMVALSIYVIVFILCKTLAFELRELLTAIISIMAIVLTNIFIIIWYIQTLSNFIR